MRRNPRKALVLAAAAAVFSTASAAAAQEEPEEPPATEAEVYAREENEIITLRRAYEALVHEEHIWQDFRAYLAPDYLTYRQSRGRLTDKIRFNGSVREQLVFDNNIHLTHTDETSDTISITNVSLNASLEDERLRANLDYVGRERVFTQNSEFSGMENFAIARIQYEVEHAKIELWNNYARYEDPIQTIVLRDRVDTFNNLTGGRLTLDFDRVDVAFTGVFQRHDIKAVPLDHFDFDHVGASMVLTIDIEDRTQAVLETGRNATDFDEPILLDFETRWVIGGIQGRPMDKLLIDLLLGWIGVYVDADPADPTGRSQDNLMSRATMVWRPSISTLVTFGLRRDVIESIITGFVVVFRIEGGIDQWVSERVALRARAQWTRGDEEGHGGDRTDYAVMAGIKYEIGRNFYIDTWAEFRGGQNLDIEEFAYEDFRAAVSVGVEW